MVFVCVIIFHLDLKSCCDSLQKKMKKISTITFIKGALAEALNSCSSFRTHVVLSTNCIKRHPERVVEKNTAAKMQFERTVRVQTSVSTGHPWTNLDRTFCCFFVLGQRNFLVPAFVARDKGRSKNLGTNSSVPECPVTNNFLFIKLHQKFSKKKDVQISCFKMSFSVLERPFPVL